MLGLDSVGYSFALACPGEVKTRLVDHPSDDAPEDERYVWVDVRKPTAAELTQHFKADES